MTYRNSYKFYLEYDEFIKLKFVLISKEYLLTNLFEEII